MALLRENIIEMLRENTLVSDIQIFSELDSTNRYLKDLAKEGAEEGTVIIANKQSSGRGRLGRSFFSPEGTGIYMSILLRPNIELQKSVRITSMAAVAVARAIEKVSGIETKIKWVNDIFLNDKKVCGILTESGINTITGALDYAVLGIGINVGKIQFPEELKEIATSVCNECNHIVTRNDLVVEILKELQYWYPSLWNGRFLQESKQRSILLGKEILVIGEKNYYAKAVDLDDMGHLWIEKEGKKELLHSGEVSIKF